MPPRFPYAPTAMRIVLLPALALAFAAAPVPTSSDAAAVADTAPEIIAEGTFTGTRRYDVSGRALLVRLDDGSHEVRLEGLDSDGGPDLRVWIVTDLRDKASGRVDLGRLQSRRGDRTYRVPAGTDVSGARGISIWCRAFSVEFGTARLR